MKMQGESGIKSIWPEALWQGGKKAIGTDNFYGAILLADSFFSYHLNSWYG